MASVIKKKKHVSKKNKKDWRKHCNIEDVENFLEDQRLEERLGKFDSKPDSELFVIDTEGHEVEEKALKPLSLKEIKRAKLSEGPKCFEILIPSSKVPDPKKTRNHTNPVGHKPTALSKVTDKRKYEKGIYQKNIEMARKNRKMAVDKRKNIKLLKNTFDTDLWDGNLPKCKGIPETLCEEFISPGAQLHNMSTMKRLRTKPALPKTVITRSAIEKPHPGISYNPSFKEHQDLLNEVVKHEQQMIKKENHILRVTNGMFRKITRQQNENQWKEEMSVGLPHPSKPSEDKSDAESDNEYKAINPPVKNKKKDHKARRKQRERLVEIEKLKREKINKKKITDIYRLRRVEAAISSTEQRQQSARETRSDKRSQQALTASPALNAHKVPQREPDFVPPEELAGDLRHISPSASLLRDRYQALQHRGALAGAKLMMKKKRRVKSYFKSGHKVTEKDAEDFIKGAKGAKGATKK